MSERQKQFVIAAGGTAGHVAPALAVADALRSEGARVTFIGGERAEAELVPAAGYPLRQIAVEGLARRSPARAARSLAKSAHAVWRCRSILDELRPAAVMGGGGYVAGPVGLAAVSRRIPLVLTEADSQLGISNRLLARFARRVCLSFPIDGLTAPRYRVTGRPIPVAGADRARARARFAITPEQACLLVFGGSLGARTINRAALDAFAAGYAASAPALGDATTARKTGGAATAPGEDGAASASGQQALASGELRVLHVCGRRDYAECSARPLRPGYDLREYLDFAAFADALAASDLVLARAGGSVFEIAAYGRPAILVPYPHATGDHQAANAQWMAAAGAAVVIADAELTPERLKREVGELLADPARLEAMAAASRALARPDAAREVAAELLEAAR